MKLTQQEKADKLIRYMSDEMAEHFARKLTGDDVRALVLAFRAENAQGGEREARCALRAVTENPKAKAITMIATRVGACEKDYVDECAKLEEFKG